MEDLDLLDSVADNIAGPHHLRAGRRRGDAGASFIKHFRDEFEHHIEHKRCLVPTTQRLSCDRSRSADAST